MALPIDNHIYITNAVTESTKLKLNTYFVTNFPKLNTNKYKYHHVLNTKTSSAQSAITAT